jgi:20S proteasome alpha/beta subunit
MTIALGVLCGDGLIIAADTEESDGFLKTSASKISIATNIYVYASVGKKPRLGRGPQEIAACAVAGAGDSAYLDTITPMLIDDFQETEQADEDAIQGEFSKTVRKFYIEHVVPFAQYPAIDRPDFSVLVGVSRKDKAELLFASSKTTLRRCAPFAAVGVGATFANQLLKRLWPQTWVDRKTAALLVAFIMFHVKESVENCGKLTDVVVMHNGTRTYMPWELRSGLEAIFFRYSRIEGDVMHAIFSMSDSHQKQSVDTVSGLFKELRHEIENLAKTWTI